MTCEIMFVNSFLVQHLCKLFMRQLFVGLASLRMEFAFELATTKNEGRVFLFAASTAEDRRVWMAKLGQVSSCYFICLLFMSDYFV